VTAPTAKDRRTSTESMVAAIRFGISIIKDQIERTEQKDAVAFLQERAAYFAGLVGEINEGKIEGPSYADLSSLYNMVSSYHNARMSTTPYEAAANDHFYNAAVGTLRDDLADMGRAAERQ
jgi:hypothetical protein